MALDINKIRNTHLLDVDQQRSVYEAKLLLHPDITTSEKQIDSPYKKDSLTSSDLTGLSLKVKVAAYDAVKFAKFSKTSSGILFHLSQAGLQFSNPISENPDNRIYNPVKLAANILTAPFGFRVRRDGVIGINYENINKTGNDNRLVKIYTQFQTVNKLTAGIKKTKLGQFLSFAAKTLGVNNVQGKVIAVQSGVGGPNSLYGVGNTIIRTLAPGNPVDIANRYDFNKKYNSVSNIKIKYTGGGKLSIIDQDDLTNKSDYVINALALGYPTVANSPKRFNYFENYVNDTNYFSNYLHSASMHYTGVGGYSIPNTNKNILLNDKVDPIYANVLVNEVSEDGTPKLTPDFIILAFNNVSDSTKWIQFRATIEGLSFKISPEWESVTYTGRPEKFHLYKGFNRTVDFNFTAVALSGDLINMYRKLDYLAGCCMPRGAGRMQAPIMKLRIGNLLYANGKNSAAGIITALNYDVDDSYIWDTTAELPMYMKVTVSYEIIETDANILAGITSNKHIFNSLQAKIQNQPELKPASEREYRDLSTSMKKVDPPIKKIA